MLCKKLNILVLNFIAYFGNIFNMISLKTLADKDPEAYKKFLTIIEDGHFSWNGQPGCRSFMPITINEPLKDRLECQSPIPSKNKRKLVPVIKVKSNGDSCACLCELEENSNKKVCK